jgi:hypothetical protein
MEIQLEALLGHIFHQRERERERERETWTYIPARVLES